MAITFTPLHPVIAAECSGIEIGQALTNGEAEVIDAGMDRYGVLIFRRAADHRAADRLHQEFWRAALSARFAPHDAD